MSKKIALVLILVLLVNMSAWANTSSTTEEEDETFAALVVLGIVFLVLVVVGGIMLIAEADAPDDGVRLASSQAEEAVSKATLNPLVNILSHVEVGKSQNDKVYAGLRFRF